MQRRCLALLFNHSETTGRVSRIKLLLGVLIWQSVTHLDLLPASLVLIHWLTGPCDGLPHVGDDFCHLCDTKPAHLNINLRVNDATAERKPAIFSDTSNKKTPVYVHLEPLINNYSLYHFISD